VILLLHVYKNIEILLLINNRYSFQAIEVIKKGDLPDFYFFSKLVSDSDHC